MEQINLYDLIKFYGRKWRVLVVLTVAGLLAGLVYNTFIQVPMFSSDSKLILVSSPSSQTANDQTLINNYIDLITSRRVLEPVILKQNNSVTYEKLLTEVNAVNQKNTEVINITVTTTNAKQSTDIANEINDSFKTAVNDLYKESGVIVVDPAVQPNTPSNVHKGLQLLITSGAGLVLSLVALFFVYDYTGGKIKPALKKKVNLSKSKKTFVSQASTAIFAKKASKVPAKKSKTPAKKIASSKAKPSKTKKS